jgi:hypothetical protein
MRCTTTFLCWILLASCSGSDESAPADAGAVTDSTSVDTTATTPETSPDTSADDTASPVDTARADTNTLTVVDGGNECKKPPISGLEVRSCCNGEVCEGVCAQAKDDPAPACYCIAKKGGCAAGTVCCPPKGGCSASCKTDTE